MDQLKRVLDFCTRYQASLNYSLVSLLTAVCEYVFSAVLFKCPCNSDNTLYGLSFLLVPALILFLFGCIWNARMWRMVTGCHQEQGCSRCYHHVLIPALGRASVASFTWIAVALLGASFYECAASGTGRIKYRLCKDRDEMCPARVPQVPCNKTLAEQMYKTAPNLQAQSQLIGLFLILVIVIVGMISTCVSHCCSPVSYMQLEFWKIYLKKEKELFEIKAKEHAATLAERNINSFFQPPIQLDAPSAFQTPSNEDWQKISLLYTFSPQEQHYSMVHKFVDTDRGSTAKFRQGNMNPTVLGFVDEAGLRKSET